MKLGLAHLIDPRLLPLADETRAFYARRGTGRGPSDEQELRDVRAAAPALVPSDPPAVTERVMHAGREVPVRIQTPTSGAPRAVILEIHGGGFYLGPGSRDDLRNRALADALGVAVVSVDHRLAPEDPWPAAPDDVETAALWLAENAVGRFGTDRLLISGFSAGSTLAVTAPLRLRDRGIDAFTGAVLQFGTYDLSAQTPSGRLIADEWFLGAYARRAADRTDPDISPIFADLTGMPPTLLIVGAEDILLHDNLAMAGRLSAARVDVDLRVYPAAPHGFTGHATSMARAALDDLEKWIRDRLADRDRPGNPRPRRAGTPARAAGPADPQPPW
ncbi:alpha/beta hydrolase [Microbacterium sp. 22242]|uniref:alpha/beta hydrolase n=1 Tax=Microbacterium sp. 22242 TaxID=3453896 RepID=UPI003F8698EC